MKTKTQRTISEQIRAHLLATLNYPQTYDEQCEQIMESLMPFVAMMLNRLIIGDLRYGRIGASKPIWDRRQAIIDRIVRYNDTGNDELLVDIANLAFLESEEGQHQKKHFAAVDDGEHVGRNHPGTAGKETTS